MYISHAVTSTCNPLSLTGGSLTVESGGCLTITGDVSMSGQFTLVIQAGACVVINGNLSLAGNAVSQVNGTLTVNGNYNQTGNANSCGSSGVVIVSGTTSGNPPCSTIFPYSFCAFKYRKRITFDPAQVSGASDLTNFPALISFTVDNDLRTTANSGHVENATGYDIIFTSEDGVTQLNHDLGSYNASTGALTCWVKIPNLSTTLNTYIYMYYGNTGVITNQSHSNTWSNGYVGVWHFDNAVTNSTGTVGLNGTNNGSTNTGTSMFGSARNFVRTSSQYIDVTPYNSAYDLNSNITVSAWVRLATVGIDQKIAGNQNNSTGGWKFRIFSDNKMEFEIRTSANATVSSASAGGGSALAATTWYYVVGQYSDGGDFINTYLNGGLDRTLSTPSVCGLSNGTMKIGRQPFAAADYLNGIMDELRVSSVIRSADWIATEYNNQSSPSTFYSISAEPKVWTGATNGNWATNSNWSGAAAPAPGNDVIIDSAPANQPTLNTTIAVSSIWTYSLATLNLGTTRTLSIAYDVLNCGTINGNTGMLTMNSAPANIQTQYLSGVGTYSLNKLTINNTFSPSPQVTLGNTVNVSGAMLLTSGIINTSAENLLVLGNSATSSSGSSASYVSGPMTKSGNANFVFPVGKGTSWRRIGISNVSVIANFQAEYFNTIYTGTTSNVPLQKVSSLEYWQLDRLTASGDANVSLYWEDAGLSGINTCTDLTIGRWNGASWDERTGTTVAGSTCSGTGTGTVTTSAVVTAFSPFTFGSRTAGLAINPLPIELIHFNADCGSGGKVLLNWSTASQKNNNFFTIEKSGNGTTYESLVTIKGEGTNSSKVHYNYSDDLSQKGIWYYRLKQTDYDGEYKYSNVVAADCRENDKEILIYPNPTSGQFTVRPIEPGAELRILNAWGQEVFKEVVLTNQEEINLPVKGIYFLYISGKEKMFNNKILVH